MWAGLGSGSSDAATALHAANRLAGFPVSQDELIRWGADLGSDVGFFLSRGTAYCTGRGEIVEARKPLAPCAVYLIKPTAGCSTPKAPRYAARWAPRYARRLTGRSLRRSTARSASARARSWRVPIRRPSYASSTRTCTPPRSSTTWRRRRSRWCPRCASCATICASLASRREIGPRSDRDRTEIGPSSAMPRLGSRRR